MTKQEAMKLVALLKAGWPRQELGAETISLYADMLKDIPLAEAQAAVQRIVQTSKWFPTIAEIREQVAEARCALDPPELAWGEVQRAISSVGAYHQPLFDNPAIQRAVNAMGWRQICLDENLAATRARFVDAYKAARAQQIECETTGRQLASPYGAALPGKGADSLEHGSVRFVGKTFALPMLTAGEDPPPADDVVQGLARKLRLVPQDVDEGGDL